MPVALFGWARENSAGCHLRPLLFCLMEMRDTAQRNMALRFTHRKAPSIDFIRHRSVGLAVCSSNIPGIPELLHSEWSLVSPRLCGLISNTAAKAAFRHTTHSLSANFITSPVSYPRPLSNGVVNRAVPRCSLTSY